MPGEIGLLRPCEALVEAPDQGFLGCRVARLHGPAQAVARPADLDLRAIAEPGRLVAQIRRDIVPHAVEAEILERGFGVPDVLAGERKGRRLLAALEIAPAVAQAFVAAARDAREIELLRLGDTAPQDRQDEGKPAQPHVSVP